MPHSSDRAGEHWFKPAWNFLTAPLHGKVLAVGCGLGDEAIMLADLPNVTEVIAYDPGVDPNELSEYFYFHRSWDAKTPLRVTACHCDVPLDCDCAFSWNVTEHFLRPIEDFEFVCGHLKMGGLWAGRHHLYYSPQDGHHANIPCYEPLLKEFCEQHSLDYPHLQAPKLFVSTFRAALRVQDLNLMTLSQLHAYALMAGFQVNQWQEISWGARAGEPESLPVP